MIDTFQSGLSVVNIHLPKQKNTIIYSTGIVFQQKSVSVSNWLAGVDVDSKVVDIQLRRVLWTRCLGHAGVKGNDQADRMASKATLTSGLLFGRSEVLRSLRHYLQAQSQGHHTIDRLEERGVERRSARRSFLKGREKATVNQTNIGTVSKATLGKLLRDGAERIWAFPSA